ncbi:HD domain-containing protein, partial [Acinetobacter baumannii]|uniref:HD domain-containing protein n=2 Tax=Gammaproteobacteria TaxID=1236 RepID=UPI00312C9E18
RTRLTHSLEVASIGRYLAEKISEQLFEKGMLGEQNSIETLYRTNAFISFVEVSCLMHDLGNPPFGHFGEASIQEWFA